MAKVDKVEESLIPDEKAPLEPLNETAYQEPKKVAIQYTGAYKTCEGNSSKYEDNADNFPAFVTLKGTEKNSYSKDFLEKKAKGGTIEKRDGKFYAVDTSK